MPIEEEALEEKSGGLEAHLRRAEERRARLGAELESRLTGMDTIALEIGCGHGHWLTDYSGARPEIYCVGIDLIGDRIERAKRKAGRAKRENLLFVKAEASEFLDQLPREVRIQSVFILFPDPWPKKRHWKNRIMNPGFLERLGNRCQEGARLYFRTDHLEYFEWAEAVVESAEKWDRLDGETWPFERETVFQSKADSYRSLILGKRNTLS